MSKIRLAVVTAFGLEAVVKKELQNLGYENFHVENGWIFFEGKTEDIPRLNIFLRSAERVLLVADEFKAESFTELFDNTKKIPWQDWITKDGKFTVTGKSRKSKLFSVPDCQSIVKKAIVEKLKEHYDVNWFNEKGAEYTVQISLDNDKAVLTIDTTGTREGLFKRGYRADSVSAPLKETLAAALVQLSFWHENRVLMDPMCGSGTIPIEACLIGTNRAPGIYRKFESEKWPAVNEKFWTDARLEAESLIDRDIKLQIYASDMDKKAVRIAQKNAVLAGVSEHIKFQIREIKDIILPCDYGIMITNPPYGERISDENEIIKITEDLGRIFGSNKTWSNYIISSFESFEKYYGKKASRRRKLFNGNIKVQYYQYYGEKPNN